MNTFSPHSAGRDLVSPAALMALQSLELRAKVVMEGFLSGLHRSPFHGFSAEFTEYRSYVEGDDLRHLDWRVLARSDRYFIRKYEDETNLRCCLTVDQSRSMDYGTLGYTKAEYAATLAATLALFLQQQGDAVGLLSFDAAVRDWLPPGVRRKHLRQIMLALEAPAGGSATDLLRPLQRLLEIQRKRSLLVIISDFLASLEVLQSPLVQLTASGHEILLLQVLDPSEQTFAFEKEAYYEDAETGQKHFIDPKAAQANYVSKFSTHQAQLTEIAFKLGLGMLTTDTAQPLERVLSGYLRERLRLSRGGRVHRRSS